LSKEGRRWRHSSGEKLGKLPTPISGLGYDQREVGKGEKFSE